MLVEGKMVLLIAPRMSIMACAFPKSFVLNFGLWTHCKSHLPKFLRNLLTYILVDLS